MNTDDIFMKTKKFVESKSHEQVLQGCGEPPSTIQIKMISDCLATLPKRENGGGAFRRRPWGVSGGSG